MVAGVVLHQLCQRVRRSARRFPVDPWSARQILLPCRKQDSKKIRPASVEGGPDSLSKG